MHCCLKREEITSYFFYHLQQGVVRVALVKTGTDTSRSTQDPGGLIFYIHNNFLKSDYAIVTRVFFHIFVNLTAAKVM